MKGTGAKRNVCPGSCVSTGAKFPVAPVESAPMVLIIVASIARRLATFAEQLMVESYFLAWTNYRI